MNNLTYTEKDLKEQIRKLPNDVKVVLGNHGTITTLHSLASHYQLNAQETIKFVNEILLLLVGWSHPIDLTSNLANIDANTVKGITHDVQHELLNKIQDSLDLMYTSEDVHSKTDEYTSSEITGLEPTRTEDSNLLTRETPTTTLNTEIQDKNISNNVSQKNILDHIENPDSTPPDNLDEVVAVGASDVVPIPPIINDTGLENALDSSEQSINEAKSTLEKHIEEFEKRKNGNVEEKSKPSDEPPRPPQDPYREPIE